MNTRPGLITGVAVIAMLTSSLAGADDSQRWPWSSLVGAWEVEVTVREDAADCTTSPPVTTGVNPFPSFNTFHEDGTMSETGSRSPPSMRSPGHGVWERTGRLAYVARHKFQGFDATGQLFSNMDVRANIRLARNGLSFTGHSRLNFSIVNGPTLPFCATLSGTRITL